MLINQDLNTKTKKKKNPNPNTNNSIKNLRRTTKTKNTTRTPYKENNQLNPNLLQLRPRKLRHGKELESIIPRDPPITIFNTKTNQNKKS